MEKNNAELIRKLAAECTLLLRKDGSFPLEKPCSVALFGNGARHTVRGGTGSGDVYSKKVVSIDEGLRAAGFTVTTDYWLKRYDLIRENARDEWMSRMKKQVKGISGLAGLMGMAMPEPAYSLSTDYPGDICIYVLSRVSGEGNDRKAERGDILLTETEVRDINALNARFEKFMLVLNTGGPVDLSEVADADNILQFSQLGPLSGDILADILLGKSIPSGKLATTWAAWGDYCGIGDFGGPDDIRYLEGIYVGYRYFDTTGVKPLYPFGYGLTYTDFSLGKPSVTVSGTEVRVSISVKNKGNYPGREVVQIYVSVPEGKLDQPYQTLAAFAKTDMIDAGGSERISLFFDMKDLASYDEDSASYILEAGDYIVLAGDSSADTKTAAVLVLPESVTLLKAKNVLGDCGSKDWRPDSRLKPEEKGAKRIPLDPADFTTETVDYGLAEETCTFAEGLTDEELCYMGIGHFSDRQFSVIGEASATVAGAAGDFTTRLTEKGFPAVVTADGPAGLRLEREYYRDEKGIHNVTNDGIREFSEVIPDLLYRLLARPKKIKPGTKIYEQSCTMLPAASAVAQSFDTALAERMGNIAGEEMAEYGVDFWLAPALNIHRDIRCGRNFEYYSEDPLVSGKMAAAVVRGAQSKEGRFATIKHYAANNQETMRYSSNSLVSERAMRDIYLRGFGICVREAEPGAVMTSYNLLNGTHTASHKGLIRDILRCEFGFRGIVMTDWIVRAAMSGGRYRLPLAWEVAAAGGDVLMPGSKADWKTLLKGLKEGKVSRRQLEINATRLYLSAKRKKK